MSTREGGGSRKGGCHLTQEELGMARQVEVDHPRIEDDDDEAMGYNVAENLQSFYDAGGDDTGVESVWNSNRHQAHLSSSRHQDCWGLLAKDLLQLLTSSKSRGTTNRLQDKLARIQTDHIDTQARMDATLKVKEA
jgi:hypothetical protein